MSARSTTDRTRRPARVNTNPQETHHEAPHRTRHVPRQLGHVHRGRISGSQLGLVDKMSPDQLDRALAKIVQKPGCWTWTGYVNTFTGYAQWSYTWADGTTHTARIHRLAYEVFVGPIPDGMVLDHLCENKACVNPAHLEVVTQAENMRRVPKDRYSGTNSGMGKKTHCPQGHPYAGDNLRIRANGSRRCLACAAADSARRTERLRAARQQEAS